MIKQLLSPAIALLSLASPVLAQNAFHVTYLWHMHQPIYYPYESANVTDSSGLFNFSIRGVHDARLGSYGEWPKNAVQQGTDIPHAGVQVSFSGSLMENMNNLYDTGWRDHYRYARNTLRTSLNNPRLDTVGIAYHHSLMPLTTKESMRMQIRLHKEAYFDNWASGGNYSKGFWPPECAFDVNMIPALVAEGLEWVIVDNGHFDRACQNYPWAPAASIRPNKSDQINPDPASIGSQWVQLNNVWAPTKVSAPWGYQPHRVQYVDPNSDPAHPVVQRIVAVPGARYEGNENGRGGYGAFKPQNVWGDKVSVNNNAAHPMLILCHSDGDNYGMLNADAYNGQHGNFLNMVRTNPDFEHTSVQDYLDLYPVPTNDIIQVEPGSWVGIDGGTPYFDKWRENNAVNGEHPDLWSWSVLVAAANRVITADSLENSYSMNDVRWGIGPDTAKAWHFFLQAETSCYWYWDFDRANPWDGNATRGCNFAVAEANKVIARHTGTDTVGPTIWPPQRDIYNPGGKSFNETALQSSDFTVSTFADDVSGIPSGSVKLYWRTDNDGINPLNEYDNELYAYNSAKTSAWSIATMTADWYPTVQGPKVPTPACRAMRYQGMVSGQNNVLIDYFVEATDTKGNVSRSDIKHVWVGDNTGGGGGGGGSLGNGVTLDPVNPVAGSPVKIKYNPVGRGLSSASPVYLHVGQNGWLTRVTPRPAMTLVNGVWEYTYTPTVGTTALNIVFTANPEATSNLAWDNNSGSNWNTSVTTSSTTEPPDRPLNPSVVALSHVSLSLDWEDAPRATGYTIYRNDVEIGTSSTSQLLDTGLNPETSYSYRVLATNTAGSSGLSDIFQGTTFFSPVETHGLRITSPTGPSQTNSSVFLYQGQAGLGLTNGLGWTNISSGQGGVISFTGQTNSSGWAWSASIPLSSGSNTIRFTGSYQSNSGTMTNGADSAMSSAYSSGWGNGLNGGSGFGPWSFVSTGSAGSFLAGASHTNMNVGASNGFGLWANSGGTISAIRNFNTSMSTGSVLTLRFDNNWINSGSSVGVALADSGNTNRFAFSFIGGETNYRISDATAGRISGIPYTSGGLLMQFELTASNTYRLTVGTNVVTNTLASGGEISKLVASNNNSGPDTDYNFYLGEMVLTSPQSTTISTTMDSPVITLNTTTDGLPNSWWIQYFGSTTGVSASTDSDGDGFTNLQEYALGTDPTSATSTFKVGEITRSGNTLTVSWVSVSEKSYQIQTRASLSSGSWADTGSVITASGTTSSTSVSVPADATAYFVRVSLVP